MFSFLGGLSLQVKACFIAAVFVGGFMLGWAVHGWKTDAGQARSINSQIKTATTLQNESAPIIEKKIADLDNTRVVYRTIKEKVYEKNDTGICFDAESLSLWNRAIAGADSHRPEPDRAAAEPDTTERYVANVEQVLSNAADNYEICNGNKIKHNALLDKLETLKGKMCVCSE
jgi:hypothetical protein